MLALLATVSFLSAVTPAQPLRPPTPGVGAKALYVVGGAAGGAVVGFGLLLDQAVQDGSLWGGRDNGLGTTVRLALSWAVLNGCLDWALASALDLPVSPGWLAATNLLAATSLGIFMGDGFDVTTNGDAAAAWVVASLLLAPVLIAWDPFGLAAPTLPSATRDVDARPIARHAGSSGVVVDLPLFAGQI